MPRHKGYKSLPNLAVFVIFLILAKKRFFSAPSTHTGHTESWVWNIHIRYEAHM